MLSQSRPSRRRRLFIGFLALTLLLLIVAAARNETSSSLSDSKAHNELVARARYELNDVDASDDAMLDELHLIASPFANLSHLIMVAGHAVLTTSVINEKNVKNADSWLLLDYQKKQLATFLHHIESGVKLASRLPESLLLFSGGETRRAAGPRSEAQSYWLAAEAMNWFDENIIGVDWLSSPMADMTPVSRWSIRSRSSTEEHARDSFENLVFSICRFHELTGRYPDHISVIGFEFKAERFVELHRGVMRYPRERFTYIGIDPEDANEDQTQKRSRERGEAENSLKPFTADPHGCHASLRRKKQERNPWHRSHGYGHGTSCPELKQLLHHCGNDVYEGPLPWD